MSYSQEERKQLEDKILQQNLIHELVFINELLLMEESKLRKQVKQIPRLKQKILDLEREIQQTDQQNRIGQAREEAAAMQKQPKLSFPQYHKAVAHGLAEERQSSETVREKTFSSSKP